MSIRIQVTLSDEKEKMLLDLMKEDNESDEPMASYLVRLIPKMRGVRDEAKNKKSPGRPRKADDEDMALRRHFGRHSQSHLGASPTISRS